MSKATKRSRADAFGSLLGSVSAAVSPADANAVPIDRITVRPGQPRRFFDEASLASLAQSIQAQGVLQPVLLRPAGDRYELIAGERRLRAAKLAGLTEIPATVRDVPDTDADLMAALENLQREDLNPLDEVEATLTIIARDLGVTEAEVIPLLHAQRRTPDPAVVAQLDQVFSRVGRGSWRSFATNKAGVLRFAPELLTLMRQGHLEYTRAAALSRVKDERRRAELLRRTLEENLSVRDITLASRTAPAPESPVAQVRRLLDDRRVAQLGQRERARAEKLLKELATLLGSGVEPKESRS
ncbi:ParB/RepB/Spo0J family partition protein [Deinococcus taeanensis]|uniref:ParB/RepB/Spo0J family partition protein n=1 Tax=Deinococcus taeanensis TaxID=2737050 RepID=UPI002103F586|nr:ParB/RepB/Spo0J family partition protein [Deinococcus taeanensis]